MTFDLNLPGQLLRALTPDLVLMVGAMAVMLLTAWRKDSAAHQRTVGIAALVVVLATVGAVVMAMFARATAGPGVIAVDRFRWTVDLVILAAAGGSLVLAIERNDREGVTQGELHALILFAAAGMMILAAARDLMVLFLGIEIMSVASYVLAGMNRRSPRAAEASLKYFLLGAFATGFLLYGIALIYGATGTTAYATIAERVGQYGLGDHPMLLVGLGLLTIGLGFKIAAAPFHMWAPDVYDGAPTPVTSFFASAVKAAVFAAMARLWIECFPAATEFWRPALWWVAAVTMVVGNVVALAQQNLKRILAYSSIAHTGYLLIAILANTGLSAASLVFYVAAYTLATFGAFAVVAIMQGDSDAAPTLHDITGLWHVRPWLAGTMAVFMLSLMGFPVFGGVGFFAKWYLLRAALEPQLGLATLVVLAVLASVVSAGYYLEVVRVMFMKQRADGAADVPAGGPLTRTVIVATAIAILVLGVFPGPLANFSNAAPLYGKVFAPVDVPRAR